ncbi:hypothetical protein OAF65_01615 [Verrucomicrobiales bacterium]|nr:hypothetical protein [Verrucomicrobiales bacterium]
MELESFRPELLKLKRKAQAGDRQAAMDLARRYLNGNFVKIDEKEAKKWALKAFEGMSDEEISELS